jgi:hypothetical protein
MRRGSTPVSLLALDASFTVSAQGPQATVSAAAAIPSTRAGHALATWLKTFDSGNREEIESYCETYRPEVPVDAVMNFRNATGGFDLVSIGATQPRHIKHRGGDAANTIP